jgi:hypothetical protein
MFCGCQNRWSIKCKPAGYGDVAHRAAVRVHAADSVPLKVLN